MADDLHRSPQEQKISDVVDADAEDNNEQLLKTITTRIQLLAREVLFLNPQQAVARTTEYLRFMQLKKDDDDEFGPSGLAPSRLVDELWHAHLQDTRSYRMLESYLYPKSLYPGGRNIEHNPIKTEQPKHDERLAKTKINYSKKFYAAPPNEIWSEVMNPEVENEGAHVVVHKVIECRSEARMTANSTRGQFPIILVSPDGERRMMKVEPSDSIYQVKVRFQRYQI